MATCHSIVPFSSFKIGLLIFLAPSIARANGQHHSDPQPRLSQLQSSSSLNDQASTSSASSSNCRRCPQPPRHQIVLNEDDSDDDDERWSSQGLVPTGQPRSYSLGARNHADDSIDDPSENGEVVHEYVHELVADDEDRLPPLEINEIDQHDAVDVIEESVPDEVEDGRDHDNPEDQQQNGKQKRRKRRFRFKFYRKHSKQQDNAVEHDDRSSSPSANLSSLARQEIVVNDQVDQNVPSQRRSSSSVNDHARNNNNPISSNRGSIANSSSNINAKTNNNRTHFDLRYVGLLNRLPRFVRVYFNSLWPFINVRASGAADGEHLVRHQGSDTPGNSRGRRSTLNNSNNDGALGPNDDFAQQPAFQCDVCRASAIELMDQSILPKLRNRSFDFLIGHRLLNMREYVFQPLAFKELFIRKFI